MPLDWATVLACASHVRSVHRYPPPATPRVSIACSWIEEGCGCGSAPSIFLFKRLNLKILKRRNLWPSRWRADGRAGFSGFSQDQGNESKRINRQLDCPVKELKGSGLEKHSRGEILTSRRPATRTSGSMRERQDASSSYSAGERSHFKGKSEDIVPRESPGGAPTLRDLRRE
jgi:hypothetical protein